MKKTKKLLSLILALVMLASITNGMTITAKAIDSRVENAVNLAISIANDNSHGYSQTNRTGPDYDCSSLVYFAYQSAGFNFSPSWFNTSTMGNALKNQGFTEITNIDLSNSNSLQRGDILWKSGHTEIYIGSNQLVGAHQDYGYSQTGDQNGKEISVTDYYYKGSNGSAWTKVYRYGNSGGGSGYAPQGCVDVVRGETGKIYVAGWAFDKDDTSKSLTIHVYIGGPAGTSGAECHAITANQTRADVNSAYGVGNNHGFSSYISTAKTGSQGVYIYALNTGAGSDNPQIGSGTASITKDSTKPTISNAKISNVTLSGYTVTFTATDNVEIAKVQCPTWTGQNGQDDLKWDEKVTKSGNNYTCNIKVSDHKNETGDYYTHIYVYDVAGNEAKYVLDSVNILKTVQNNCSHTYTSSVTKSPTCTSTGTRTYTCTKCGYSYTSTINKTEHKWNTGTIAKTATCTATGVKTYTCTACGTTKAETIAKTAHIYDNGTVTKKPTYTETGTKEYKCTVCSEVLKTETLAKLAKKTNTLNASGKTKIVKFSTLKKNNVSVERRDAITVSKAQGKVTYAKASGNKKITVAKNGKITVKKGLKKGTYKVKVKVKAAGNSTYKSKTVTVTVTIKVK